MSRLLRLYPRSWRDRYGEEFLALLAERPSSLGDRVDIVRGAIDARLQPQVPGPDRVPDRSGFATLAGLGLVVVAVVLASTGPLHYDEYGSYRDGMAAYPFFLAAAGLLSFGFYRLMKRLPDDSFGLRCAAVLAIIGVTVWSVIPWIWIFGLTFTVSLVIFAVGSRRAGVLSTVTTVAIAAAAAIPLAVFGAMTILPWYAFRESGLSFIVVIGPLSSLWPIVGLDLLHGSTAAARERGPA